MFAHMWTNEEDILNGSVRAGPKEKSPSFSVNRADVFPGRQRHFTKVICSMKEQCLVRGSCFHIVYWRALRSGISFVYMPIRATRALVHSPHIFIGHLVLLKVAAYEINLVNRLSFLFI